MDRTSPGAGHGGRRPTPTSVRLGALVVAAALAAGACASDDGPGADDTVDDPGVTFDTLPVDEPTATSPAEPTEPTEPDEPDEPAASTTTLVPAPDADLPTEPPSDLAGPTPVTTAPGPLPVPTVRLTEIGVFDQPVEIAWRQLDNRLFVVEQPGRILAVDDLSSEVVLDIDDLVTDAGGERGLLGLAFHPELDLAYVHYNDNEGDTVLAEYAVDPLSGRFDPATARTVLTVDQPYGNHNGGEVAFGPDGLLYLGLGDGGSADDPQRTGLDLTSRLGKILRIDPLEDGDAPFLVPPDNPFVDVRIGEGPDAPAAEPTIWSVGLRNPWKFSFDPLTGDLWIADVGQNRWEEIDLAPATDGFGAGKGLNFGWSAFEGDERFNEDQSPAGHTPPVLTYPHENGQCSVSGGAVARRSPNDTLNGWYVYGDYCAGTIWALDTTTVRSDAPVVVELGRIPALVGVVEGPTGDLYVLSVEGPVHRLDPA